MSAAVLLGFFALVSRVIGLVRDKYIAHTFGAGSGTDAYNVAFQLPDLINYLLVGGAASISFVTILSRYRERGELDEGDRALSVILNTMALVLGGAILLAEVLTPLYTDRFFPRGTAESVLCTRMTRILLPAQLFFFAGGVLASVALVRKQFTYQAISPLVYTLGIIGGGLVFAGRLGISSLAWGALAGSVLGPFAVNAFAARRAGVRYRPVLDFGNPGLRDWVRMSLPLMLGVSVVFLDNYILTWFAKQTTGEISKLMYAKRLFTAPMAIIGQAAGAASLPFFASLYSKGLHQDYREAVNRSVSRILQAAFLLAAVMFGLAGPIVDLVFRGGAFGRQDAAQTAMYFAIFTLSLPLWASQAIYARAFFAVGGDAGADDWWDSADGAVDPDVLAAACAVWRGGAGVGVQSGDPRADGHAGGAGASAASGAAVWAGCPGAPAKPSGGICELCGVALSGTHDARGDDPLGIVGGAGGRGSGVGGAGRGDTAPDRVKDDRGAAAADRLRSSVGGSSRFGTERNI